MRTLIASPFLRESRKLGSTSGAGPFQVSRDPHEIKSAVTVALVFFLASLVLAPGLTRDQNKLAAEINSKTLKAAPAIKASPTLPLRTER